MTFISRIAVFASGNGSNAEEIFRRFKDHANIQVILLLSNNPAAYVLERAKNHGVPSKVFTRQEFNEGTILAWLKESDVTHIVLAGFLWLMPPALLEAYPDRVVNIHPALLPKYGGKGMYGMKVHEAVKASGESETGITIHLVNTKYDEGKILFQATCAVLPDDAPVAIGEKVNGLEYQHFSRVIEGWISGTRL